VEGDAREAQKGTTGQTRDLPKRLSCPPQNFVRRLEGEYRNVKQKLSKAGFEKRIKELGVPIEIFPATCALRCRLVSVGNQQDFPSLRNTVVKL
jgi:hypothetical protein